ncbi:MAG: hypothetical protein PHP70_03090 [Gallionella sp.]|nr:hypothetical protein [Gallionella sp.]
MLFSVGHEQSLHITKIIGIRMLSLIILWSTLGAIFTIIGMPILYEFNLQICLPKTEDRIFVAIWLGIVTLAILLLFVSLFIPLTWLVAALTITALALPYFLRRLTPITYQFSINRTMWPVLLVVTLVLSFFSAIGTDSLVDTGAYHHQMAKWLAVYGSVPGLALIHDRFGFTSAWFALAAPLQTGWLKDHFVIGINSFIFYLMTLQTIVMLGRIFDRSAKLGDYFFIFMFALFCHYFFSDLILSLSPDLPAALLVLILAWLIITISINGRGKIDNGARCPEMVVLILALGAVSIKLSSLPLLGIAVVYYIFARGFSSDKALAALAFSITFMTILMATSTITSGCPLYPAPYFCTDLPWSLGSENAKNMSKTILEFARWTGPTPADATNFNWIWRDPPNNNIFNDKSLMKWLFLTNILCGCWLYFKRLQVGKEICLYILFIAFAGITFTIIKAPHLRFGLAYFLVIPALACASFLLELSLSKHRVTVCSSKFKAVLIVIGACFAVTPIITTYKKIQFHEESTVAVLKVLKTVLSDPGWWILWPDKPLSPTGLAIAQSNNFKYVYPNNPIDQSLCWGAPIPCAPTVIGNSVWLRDEKAGFGKGFVKNPPTNLPIF